MSVLCLVEHDAGGILDTSLRAAAFARTLAGSADGRLIAVLFAAAEASRKLATELTACGVAEVIAVQSAALDHQYAPAAWAAALAQLAAVGPVTGIEADRGIATAVVAAATDRGSEVLAHLGAAVGEPVAANCVSARRTGPGRCELVRQRWAGSLLEDAILEASLAILTVAPDAMPAQPAATQPAAAQPDAVQAAAQFTVQMTDAPVRAFHPDLTDLDLRVRASPSAERSRGDSLATARVVVGGGRGVGGPEGFAPLEELAELLGGVLGVSRVVTSQGWRPHRQQVGQTGTKISPELYLACGISGAIQHMAGCLSAQHIVAINTDPDAPIIARADYAVIGDLAQVIPALITAIRDRGGITLA